MDCKMSHGNCSMSSHFLYFASLNFGIISSNFKWNALLRVKSWKENFHLKLKMSVFPKYLFLWFCYFSKSVLFFFPVFPKLCFVRVFYFCLLSVIMSVPPWTYFLWFDSCRLYFTFMYWHTADSAEQQQGVVCLVVEVRGLVGKMFSQIWCCVTGLCR